MRSFISFALTLVLPIVVFADAGFNIRREKAPCYAVFTGIDKLDGYEFFKTWSGYRSHTDFDSTNLLHDNDTLKISEGRRNWDGPIEIFVRNKATGQFVDSFKLIADGNNLVLNFTGVQNNKPAYTVSKNES